MGQPITNIYAYHQESILNDINKSYPTIHRLKPVTFQTKSVLMLQQLHHLLEQHICLIQVICAVYESFPPRPFGVHRVPCRTVIIYLLPPYYALTVPSVARQCLLPFDVAAMLQLPCVSAWCCPTAKDF